MPVIQHPFQAMILDFRICQSFNDLRGSGVGAMTKTRKKEDPFGVLSCKAWQHKPSPTKFNSQQILSIITRHLSRLLRIRHARQPVSLLLSQDNLGVNNSRMTSKGFFVDLSISKSDLASRVCCI
jgi:hypothetical protein